MMSHLKQTAGDLFTFVKAPTLTAEPPVQSGISDVAWLFVLNCLIVVAIAAILFPTMILFNIEMSNSMSAMFDRPIWQILGIVVIVGPIMEELLFRSWLSGNPRLLMLFGGILAGIGGSYGLNAMGYSGTGPFPLAILIGSIAIAIVAGVIRYWNSAAPGWFVQIFPIIFWVQALLFGFIHVFNYEGGHPAALLPFVLPQTVGGLIWGYARIRYGWWSNIVMHMGYNLIATSGLLYVLLSGGELVGS